MPRPRKSAVILSLQGAFKQNPQRAREDLEGAGPSDLLPPEHLPKEMVPTWNYVVERLPKIALTRTEEIGVESLVRVYHRFKESDKGKITTDEFRRLAQILLQHLTAFGMTLSARAKLGSPSRDKPENPFGKLKK